MSEILSKQSALVAANKKLMNAQDQGRDRAQLLIAPTVYAALAVGDTMGSGQKIPAGARLVAANVSCATGTGSINVGIRNFTTKVVIDATAFGSTVVTGAGSFGLLNGTKNSGGVDYVTDQESELYITQATATGTANLALVVRGVYLGA